MRKSIDVSISDWTKNHPKACFKMKTLVSFMDTLWKMTSSERDMTECPNMWAPVACLPFPPLSDQWNQERWGRGCWLCIRLSNWPAAAKAALRVAAAEYPFCWQHRPMPHPQWYRWLGQSASSLVEVVYVKFLPSWMWICFFYMQCFLPKLPSWLLACLMRFHRALLLTKELTP